MDANGWRSVSSKPCRGREPICSKKGSVTATTPTRVTAGTSCRWTSTTTAWRHCVTWSWDCRVRRGRVRRDECKGRRCGRPRSNKQRRFGPGNDISGKLRLSGGRCRIGNDWNPSLNTPAPRLPRLYTKLARLATATIHVAVVYELTSKSFFAKRRIFSANLTAVQTCPSVTTLLGIARAPTSVVRGRAQKNVRSRAQGMSRRARSLELSL